MSNSFTTNSANDHEYYRTAYVKETPNPDLSIDLSMFVTSLKTLRDNLTYVEMDQILRALVDANNRGELHALLENAEFMYKDGTDLPTSFHYAHFDIVEVQGEDF